MCIAGEEEPSGGSVGAGSGAGSVDEIHVTAARIGVDIDMSRLIDWAEVAKVAGIAALGGGAVGGWGGALSGGAAAAAAEIETQPGVDLEDLFVIKNDMIIVPGLPSPYLPMY